MRFIYLIFFLITLSCSTSKKSFVCGDHPCIDKKEFNEYFSKNLIHEIKKKKKKKKKNIDLVNLNKEFLEKKNNNKKNSKKVTRFKAKEEKKKIKAAKTKLLKERKLKKIAEKKKTKKSDIINKISKIKKNDKKILKNEISNNRVSNDNIVDKISPLKKDNLIKKTKKNISINTLKSENVKSICAEIKDCDIDKITELLTKKGQNKPFPNITSY